MTGQAPHIVEAAFAPLKLGCKKLEFPPKEMLTIVDRPTIQYIVEEVVASGIEQVILVTSEGKSAIENHFDYNFELDTILQEKNKDNLREELNHISNLIDVVSVRQKKPLGLGHAIWTTRNVVGNEPFVVLLGDDLVLSEEPCCSSSNPKNPSQKSRRGLPSA